MDIKVEDSILNSVKKLLGIQSEDISFDTDILIHINSAIFVLSQLGVVENGYMITSANDTYEEMIGDEVKEISGIKTYLFYKTKIMFDPPTNGAVLETMKQQIAELEWRLNLSVDPPETFEKGDDKNV